MAESTRSGLSTQDWMLDQIIDERPALVVNGDAEPRDNDVDAAAEQAAAAATETDHGAGHGPVHDLDEVDTAGELPEAPADVNAGAKRTLLWLGSGVALVAVLIVLAFVVFGGGPTPAPAPQHKPAVTPAVVAVPTPSNLPAPPQDQAVPFDPTTDSCPGGPTSPLALKDTTTDSAWVCSRGPQESHLDGQILHVKFMCDRSRPDSTCSYMLNAVSVTPGAVAKTPGGKDEWGQHRVVTRLQFNFYNGDQLAADPFFMDTNSVHGPVPATLPSKVLASRVDVIILHTERPPAAPLPSTNPTNPGDGSATPPPGLVDTVAGSGDPAVPTVGVDPSNAGAGTGGTSDPVDATFAMSQLQFFGHAPN